MSYRERLLHAISRYNHNDRDLFYEFRCAIDEKTPHPCTLAYYRWLFEEIPTLREAGPQVWLYKKNGQILGQQAGIPVELKIGSHNLHGSWGIDLHILHEYRLRGIGAALSQGHIADNDVTMAIGISDDAQRAYRQAGWLDLGDMPIFIFPLDLGRLLGAHGWPRLGRWGGWLGNLAIGIGNGLAGLRHADIRVELEAVECFDSDINILEGQAAKHYPIICQRDNRFLNWRYVEYPLHNPYRLFVVRHRNTVIGYSVLRTKVHNGIATGEIVDLLCKPEWTSSLLNACIGQFRKWGMAAIYCRHTAQSVVKALKAVGFREGRSGTRIMVNPTRMDQSYESLMCHQQNWFLSAGDSDADRPFRD